MGYSGAAAWPSVPAVLEKTLRPAMNDGPAGTPGPNPRPDRAAP